MLDTKADSFSSTEKVIDEPDTKYKDVEIIEEPADMVRGVPGKLSIWTLLVVVMELCERFAYYGASLMFNIYLQQILGRSKSEAVALNRVNQFMAYATTILGAIIADQFLGKFKTIVLFGIVYLVGLVVLAISSADFSVEGGFGLAGFCIAVFAFIGFGTGGIKSNVSAFMAEQIPVGYKKTGTPGVYEDSKLTTERGFRYFYWSINVGAFAGMLACPQIAKNESYAIAYMLPAIVFFIGIMAFVAGSKRYTKKKPQGTVLVKVWRCMRYARKHKQEGQGHWLDSSLGATDQEWNDEFVVGLQRSLRACKVFLFYPIYWSVYGNMTDLLINQGLIMRRPSWLSVDQLNVVNSLVLIVAIPIFDNFVFPLLRRMGFRMGPIVRITTGFAIAVCGFIYVTILQKVIYTKRPYFDFTGDDVPEGAFNDISVWLQIVPYGIIAISEIFTSVTGLEFAFSQAPAELKSVLTAVYLFTNCGGSLIGMILGIWSSDPEVLYVFAAQTIILGVLAIIFYFCFRHYDNIVAKQEQFNS
ncbi:hypothetical protein LPJ78_003667 [Coemansia sp. RSA 989]|nr:POT family-domain-containing protein [Coemansia mojavensis]KAJ1741523.1 hypothetical protein LPJ68_002754 [Coemansia sp. RSA 1086]KAJ1749766.1 hypothetical protein LPJ79_003447 [Coemansia sp. RSA 1821]KAJ1863991.1 hypothetical protein LPJ78_003667 [Coemansia sp. RSA 989]KAJ1871726.1 hypothetical protein LPJ55_003674 [Coemansia sp. RSA 990]KAJ2670189.1 hypothetical protein IWW42_004147 [Coemansia sp. RSA 1085]